MMGLANINGYEYGDSGFGNCWLHNPVHFPFSCLCVFYWIASSVFSLIFLLFGEKTSEKVDYFNMYLYSRSPDLELWAEFTNLNTHFLRSWTLGPHSPLLLKSGLVASVEYQWTWIRQKGIPLHKNPQPFCTWKINQVQNTHLIPSLDGLWLLSLGGINFSSSDLCIVTFWYNILHEPGAKKKKMEE